MKRLNDFARPALALAGLASAVFLATCVDFGTAPVAGSPIRANFALAPSYPANAHGALKSLADAGLPLDRVRIVITRPGTNEVLKDTTVTIHAGDPAITLELTVPALAGEKLDAGMQFKSGETVLFEGHAPVTALSSVATSNGGAPPVVIIVSYVGPGAKAKKVIVTPAATHLPANAPTTFIAQAFDSADAVIPNTPFTWTIGDSTLGAIDQSGIFTAAGKRGLLSVSATTLNGILGGTVDSLIPPAAKIVIASGDKQTAPVLTAAAQPLVATVLAADNLPVPNQTVTFAATDGGTITPASAVTDAAGQAKATLTFAGRLGLYNFTATSGAFSVGATGTATPGAAVAAQSVATVPAGSAGSPTAITVQAKDANGNSRTTTSGTVTAAVSGANAGAAVTVLDGNDGTYKVGYTPTISGKDTIAINLGGQPIGGSPYRSIVSAGTLHHFLVEAQGGGAITPQVAGVSFFVRITAQDANNNTVTTFTGAGNTADISSNGPLGAGATITTTFTNGVVAHAVQFTGAGTFSIKATKTGGTANGISVPFTVSAGAAVAGTTTATVPAGSAGSVTTILVQTKDANGNLRATSAGNVIAATVSGANAGASITVSDKTDGTYGITYTPLNAGTDQISITLSGAQILNSPYSSVVAPAGLHHFVVEAAAGGPIGSQVAGTPFSIRVIAQDANNNTVTTFTGAGNTVDLTSTGSLSLGGTTATFTNGVLSNVPLMISNTGSFTITATKTGGTFSGTSAAFVVAPGVAAAGMTTATVPAGTAGSVTTITVQTKDASGNNRTSSCGCTIAGAVTGSNAGKIVSVIDNGDGTYSLTYTPTVPGSDQIAITLGGSAIANSPYTSVVSVGALDHFLLEKTPGVAIGTVTADTTTITVTAKDVANNTITSYSGPSSVVTLKIGTTTIGTSVAFTSGVASATAALIFAGNQTLTATQTVGSKTGTTSVTINPNSATKLGYTTVPTNAVAGDPFPTYRVAVQDKFGNTVTSDNTTAITTQLLHGPCDVSSVNSTQTVTSGVAQFTTMKFRYSYCGNLSLQATSSPSYTGVTSGAFLVLPSIVTRIDIDQVEPQQINVPFSVSLSVYDSLGNQATNYAGSALITGVGSTVVSGSPAASFVNGKGSVNVSIASIGETQSVMATVSTTGASHASNTFYVHNPLSFNVVAPASAATGNEAQTCALTTGGTAYCWGSNKYGEMGQSSVGGYCTIDYTSTENCPAPVQITASGIPSFTSLTSGNGFSCGLSSLGAAWCWGTAAGYIQASATPTQVSGFTFSALAGAYDYACGISSGNAYCWGYNGYYNLGNDTSSQRPTPTLVYQSPHNFSKIAAGSGTACAINTSQAMYCWGYNGDYEFGDPGFSPPTYTYAATPHLVTGSILWGSVTVGGSHVCGLKSSDGTAYCWGANTLGQLGTGNNTNATSPTLVNTSLKFASISAGYQHTCALTSAGAAYCWGANSYGQLGDGTTTDQVAPVAVSGGLTFSSVKVGIDFTCGVTTSSIVYCWGNNNQYQIGHSSAVSQSTVPMRITPP